MSARETIARAISEDITNGWVEEYGETADACLKALTAAGFSIVHKDEIHAPSVERAIAVALAHIQQPGMTDNPAYVHFEPADAMAKKIAAALRELMKEVG